jgi:hypothetical protein
MIQLMTVMVRQMCIDDDDSDDVMMMRLSDDAIAY